MIYGPDYIIPKPNDHRLLTTVAPEVAKAAMKSGVARKEITDWEAYKNELNRRLGIDNQLLRTARAKARKSLKRIVFAEAENHKILRAAQMAIDERVAKPILLGNPKKIRTIAEEAGLDLEGAKIIDPRGDKMANKRREYGEIFLQKGSEKDSTIMKQYAKCAIATILPV